MRNVLLASLALASAFVANTGCVPFGCGSWEGEGNRAYERGSEMILLCNNGGFVASLETEMVEGRFASETAKIVATRGETGRRAFDLVDNFDGTASAPMLGDGAWTEVELDTVAADHSNILCNDLTARTWWNNPVKATFVSKADADGVRR